MKTPLLLELGVNADENKKLLSAIKDFFDEDKKSSSKNPNI